MSHHPSKHRVLSAFVFAFGAGLLLFACSDFDADYRSFCRSLSCSTADECCNGSACIAGACVALDSDGGIPPVCNPACSGSTPVCGADNQCHVCTESTGCGQGQVCDFAAAAGGGQCVVCTATLGCGDGTVCELSTPGGRCVQCTATEGCETPANYCDLTVDGGLCSECLPDAGSSTCRGATPYCNEATRRCVTCRSNLDCAGGDRPFCDTSVASGGECRHCLASNEGCPATEVCNVNIGTGQCVQCIDNSRCSLPQTCNSSNYCSVPGADGGVASSMVFLPSSTNITAGECATNWAVQFRNAANLPVAHTASLTFTPGTGQFFPNGNCSGAAANPIAVNGQTSVNFSFKLPAAGTGVLGVSATGLPNVTQTLTVAAGPLRQLSVGAVTTQAGVCSGQVSVTAVDAFGNPAPMAINPIELSSTSERTQFYSPGCFGQPLPKAQLFPNNATSVNYSFRDYTAGSPTHVARFNGADAGSVLQRVDAGPPSQIRVTAPGLFDAGECSPPFAATLLDLYDNVATSAAAVPIALSSDSFNASYHSPSGCSGGPAPAAISPGTSSVDFRIRDFYDGAHSMTVSSFGLDAGIAAYGVGPGPTQLDVLQTSLDVVAGQCSPLIQFNLLRNGLPTPFANSASIRAFSAGTPIDVYTQNCTIIWNGATLAVAMTQGEFFIKANRAGTHPMTVQVGYVSETIPLKVSPGAITRLVFPEPAPAVVSGLCSPPITVARADDFGNVASAPLAQEIILIPVGAAASLFSDPACTIPLMNPSIPADQSQMQFHLRHEVLTATAISIEVGNLPLIGSVLTVVVNPPGGACVMAGGFCSSGQTCCAPGGCGGGGTCCFPSGVAYGSAGPSACCSATFDAGTCL